MIGRVTLNWPLVTAGVAGRLVQVAPGSSAPVASCKEKFVAHSGQATLMFVPDCAMTNTGAGMFVIMPLR